MNKIINLAIALGVGGLLFCVNPTSVVSQPNSDVISKESTSSGQMLPIAAKMTVGGQIIELEVAETPQQQAMGLMYRKSLADNRGMLFPFEEARMTQFWMKNCLISLDMIFLLDGKIQAIEASAPPCQSEPCPTYGPSVFVDRVIELKGGRAAELGLKKGDRVSIELLK
jgi:uncharacterized membrane protein (UPF0127 family)